MQPAVALLEFDSIAAGIEAGDAMIKRAPLAVIRTGTVHPGKYLVLVAGLTGDVEEAIDSGVRVGEASLVDIVYLPDVHLDVVGSIGGARRTDEGEALGVIETRTVAAVIDAADAGRKGAAVTLRELRMADGLGGKGYVLFGGPVAEVEEAVELGVARIAGSGQEVGHVVISQLHGEMLENLVGAARFGERVHRVGEEEPPPEPPAGPAAAPTPGPAPSGTEG